VAPSFYQPVLRKGMGETGADDGRIYYPVSLALILVAMLFAFAVLPRLFTPPQSALAGKDAPAFRAPLVANAPSPEQTELSLADLKGNAVILDFWATWCGPCQAEAPLLDKVAQRFKDKGLTVVGVNTSDAPGRAHSWVAKHGISFPIVFDDGDVAPKYGVENLPTLVVVSREGKILAVRTGITSDSELEKLVTSAL
jgi:cytochrome c biogenesis protein CcmG, thiol:disulfide interchange protein DsbE